MKARFSFALTFAALAASATVSVAQAQEVTLYTTREPALIQPLLAAFTAQSKIKVNTVFVKDGLLERVKAEGERTPFDIPEADSEIVAGYMTEYSGMKFGLFYLAQYILNFLLCAVTATIFFGGWQFPGINWLYANAITPSNPNGQAIFNVLAGIGGVFVFLVKTYFFFYVMIWVRGAYPRLRVDQLMNFGWKLLIPLTLVNILSAALWVTLTAWGSAQGVSFLDGWSPLARWALAFGVTLVINIGSFLYLVRVNQLPPNIEEFDEDQVFGAVTSP